MLTCQPPLFGKSDFDQNYVYGIPEAAILTIILLSSILCKHFCNLINIHGSYFIIIFNILIVLGTIVCLVLHQRQRHKLNRQIVYSKSVNDDGQSTSKQS
jgi:hypothetical protein